ncbi:CPBP family intramembrane glutamic endopeptidase [Streptomonospora litoralis]|uniref:CAAX amino terminal protease self-immunity n=1 Tax=Streptomonospora litoralis TaxID=2498135 RepID=A0A4P6Q0M4_9ACTN|nr:CPBP family intramembrane glutamic endopeptidase [Streptomonospora litoralis]QBI52244.1 CAAX amino terminal protease self- immunity [Streptomonospora litoralis]
MTQSHSRPVLRRAITVVGLAVYAAAFGGLLLSGTTAVSPSADPGAARITLWAAAVPALAAVALARLVPPRTPVPDPVADMPERRLTLETWVLVAAAVVFPVAVAGAGDTLWYPLAKVLLFLVVPLVAFRLLRGGGPRVRAIPAPTVWLAPLPAAAAWLLLSQVVFARPITQDLPDPVTLAVGSLITLLTAGVLEEVFYRGWLQTRLEALLGRWPAILAGSLLFTLMHAGSHLNEDALGVGVASLVAYQGVFGLMQGYLWARYRNIWVLIAVHAVVNLVYVDFLVQAVVS